jgi:hypothetical protein
MTIGLTVAITCRILGPSTLIRSIRDGTTDLRSVM